MCSTRAPSDSPPREKRRRLDISDVSSLMNTKHTACFTSPERPRKHPQSGHNAEFHKLGDQSWRQTEASILSQELVEEDTYIQGSFPLYLDHVFGVCIGNSQLTECSPKDAHDHPINTEHNPLTAIVESQGFTVTGLRRDEEVSSTNDEEKCVQSSPVLFPSPVAPSQTSPSATGATPVSTCSSRTSHQRIQHQAKPVVSQTTPKDSRQPSVEKSPLCRKRKRSPSSKTSYRCPPSCVHLMDCTQAKVESVVCLFGLVLQVNSIMEVACKRGQMAGQRVPMSSLLLGDPTKPCFKLLLWREAAAWAERIVAGDVVYLSSIRLKSWREEVVGHTIMYSKVLNLHQPQNGLPSKLSVTIPLGSLQSLQEWGRARHGYLFGGLVSTPKSQRTVTFRGSDELGEDPLIHFRAKLITVISSRGGRTVSLVPRLFAKSLVVLLCDVPGKEVLLYLLGKQASLWHRELTQGVGVVWELHYLAVVMEGTQGNYSLQVTSRSHLRRLADDSADAQAILKQLPSESMAGITVPKSITALLQSRTSGTVKCMAKATDFNFQLIDGSRLALHSLVDLSSVQLVSELLQALYIGCESCAKCLIQDENDIYCPCFECMVKQPGGYPTSSYYYRPLAVTLCDESRTLEVVANHVVVCKLLSGVTAAELVRASVAQNLTQMDSVKEAVMALLTSGSADSWVLNCSFGLDQNSFIESLTLNLLDRIL